MSNLLDLRNNEYEQLNSEFLKYFPTIKVKYRDQLCVNGKKYDYIELSKVDFTKDLYMTPSVFNTDNSDTTHTLDCIGLYTIGLLEIFYMTVIRDKSFLTQSMTTLYDVLNIFNDYKEVSNMLNELDIYTNSDEMKKLFNLSFVMKSGYNREGYQLIKDYINIMMIIWLQDKKLYWQIFFEIMDFCLPISSILLEDIIWKEYKKDHEDVAIRFVSKNEWLYKEDLSMQKIEYIVPENNKVRYISDCRGICIWLTMKFYMNFISNYGEMNSKSDPYFDYKNPIFIDYIDIRLKNCIGDDDTYLALSNKYLDENPQFGLNNGLIYHAIKPNINRISRLYYENIILFNQSYSYNISDLDPNQFVNKDLILHYFSIDSLVHAIGSILFYSKELYGNDTKKLESKINNAKTENSILQNENSMLRNKINEISNNTISIEEFNNLKHELDKANALIESKQNTINSLIQKNKELTSYIDNIFDEDTIDEEIIEEQEISIDEMVQFLNDFSFTLIGGRIEIMQKLNDIGWTNIIQFDNRNKGRLYSNISLSDFYIVNTKFVSHSIVEKVQSLDNIKDTLIYYNGTNVNKLIYTCYESVKQYLNN